MCPLTYVTSVLASSREAAIEKAVACFADRGLTDLGEPTVWNLGPNYQKSTSRNAIAMDPFISSAEFANAIWVETLPKRTKVPAESATV